MYKEIYFLKFILNICINVVLVDDFFYFLDFVIRIVGIRVKRVFKVE